jgi:hypothetical protein
MAEVTVYDATRMKEIEDNTVVNGEINASSGHLILERNDGSPIDAGLVNVSPRVVTSATRPVAPNIFPGLYIYETDTKKEWVWDGAIWLATGSQMPHSTTTRVTSTGGVSASNTFVNFGVNCQIANFPKLRADTKLIGRYDGGVYNDDGAGLGSSEVAIQINGVDGVVAGGFAALMNRSGAVEVGGLAAGLYTCNLRKRRSNGVGNTSDGPAGVRNTLTLMETF